MKVEWGKETCGPQTLPNHRRSLQSPHITGTREELEALANCIKIALELGEHDEKALGRGCTHIKVTAINDLGESIMNDPIPIKEGQTVFGLPVVRGTIRRK